MPWWHRNKGVLNRSYPDFRLDKLAYLSGIVNGGPGQSWILFWNNSAAGEYFYVYKCVLCADGTTEDYQFFPTQALVGTLSNHGWPVVGNQAQPPGQIYVVGGFTPTVIPLCPFQMQVTNGDAYNIDASFPLFVIPPNSGYGVAGTGGGDAFAVNFWYVWQ